MCKWQFVCIWLVGWLITVDCTARNEWHEDLRQISSSKCGFEYRIWRYLTVMGCVNGVYWLHVLTVWRHTVCYVWIWEQTAIISLYSINWIVCITETESVYCAVRTGSLYTASLTFSNSTFFPHNVFMCFVWIWEQTAIISLYNINWLVCITETESVYCAVRTGSLNIIQVNFCL
jgi:hypothetical protein